MTTPVIPSIEFQVEAVQYTPDRDAVIIQFAGASSAPDMWRDSRTLGTTQTALSARATDTIAGVPAGYWSDAEVKAELLDYLAASGVAAAIADNVDPPQPDVPVQPTTLEQAATQAAQASPPPDGTSTI